MAATRIEHELSRATSIERIKELIDVCDKLHRGESISGYSIEDLPSDAIYEQFNQKCKRQDEISSELLLMGSIPKHQKIIPISNALIFPKFDGVSVGIKLQRIGATGAFTIEKAHTRGSDVGAARESSDITEKMRLIAPTIAFDFDAYDRSGSKLFTNVACVTIRGEIVMNFCDRDDDGNSRVSPASIIAGKINGSMDVFADYVPRMRFVAFEISTIETQIATAETQIVTPTQLETNEILSHFSYKGKNDQHFSRMADYSIKNMDMNDPDIDAAELFAQIRDETEYPIDGFVYCPSDWQYPSDKDKMTDTTYGKYAWKPIESKAIRITDIEYTMARNGRYTPIIHFDQVEIAGRKYARTKSAISKLHTMITNDQIGPGSNAILRINGSISMISEVTSPSSDPFAMVRECCWCGEKLTYEIHKKSDTLVAITCKNVHCSEILVQKYSHFMSIISKKVQIGKNISVKTIRKLVASGHAINLGNVSALISTTPNHLHTVILDGLYSGHITLIDLMVALGFGAALGVSKIINAEGYKNIYSILIALGFDENFERVGASKFAPDPFIDDVIVSLLRVHQSRFTK